MQQSTRTSADDVVGRSKKMYTELRWGPSHFLLTGIQKLRLVVDTEEYANKPGTETNALLFSVESEWLINLCL